MAKINRISFKATCNQKVIVEELIDSELKGMVGGERISFSGSDIPAGATIKLEQSTIDVQNGNARTITTETVKDINGVIEATKKVTNYVNGVQVP